MIKKIAIVPYVTVGRNAVFGRDGHLNIFKKGRSAVLKENLQSAFALKNREIEVIVDVNHGESTEHFFVTSCNLLKRRFYHYFCTLHEKHDIL